MVARTHEKWGERPHAFIILKAHSASKWKGREDAFAEELKAFAKARLPGFACPEWVQILELLPVRPLRFPSLFFPDNARL